jgi:hypothetical protein
MRERSPRLRNNQAAPQGRGDLGSLATARTRLDIELPPHHLGRLSACAGCGPDRANDTLDQPPLDPHGRGGGDAAAPGQRRRRSAGVPQLKLAVHALDDFEKGPFFTHVIDASMAAGEMALAEGHLLGTSGPARTSWER